MHNFGNKEKKEYHFFYLIWEDGSSSPYANGLGAI
jgi:hypothetical protein